MRFLLFGTGDYYERYKEWFKKEDILALIDNSLQKQSTLIDSIRVLSPQQGVKLSFDAVVILSFYVEAMRTQLVELGVPEEKIFHFYDLHELIYRKEMKKPVQYYGNAEEIALSDMRFKNKVLLLSQDLTLGGPSIALLHAAEILAGQGYPVVYASMIDGPLRDRLLSRGIPVVVDRNLQIETMADVDWMGNFSMILCNTINFHVFLTNRNISIPVIWWLHDSSFFYGGVRPETLRGIDRTNMKICSVGPVPEAAMQKFVPDISAEELLYGVEDIREPVDDLPHKEADIKEIAEKPWEQERKISFVTIGYIEERKGQDLLVQVIDKLPQEIRKKSIFYLVGQNSSLLAQRLSTEVEHIPQCVMTGTVNREKIKEILSNADVLICPSREDPMPTVAAEAMMHGVPCIVSDVTGTAGYLKDGVNGFVFENGNLQDLSAKIKWCIEHPEELCGLGTRAREIYEEHFSMNAFAKRLLCIMDEILSQ